MASRRERSASWRRSRAFVEHTVATSSALRGRGTRAARLLVRPQVLRRRAPTPGRASPRVP
eukprot:7404217-Alexandrium_andersonii.AAC.1